jgi:hypothetical protein
MITEEWQARIDRRDRVDHYCFVSREAFGAAMKRILWGGCTQADLDLQARYLAGKVIFV